MKNTYFIIKIGDLLQETGKSDAVTFDHAFSDQIPGLSKEGVSGELNLYSLNRQAVYGTLEDISCTINEVCESCEASYAYKLHIPSYSARFVLTEEIRKEERETTDEEIFLINARNETIDVEDMIAQSVVLESPFVKRCPACEERINKLADDEFDDIPETPVGNVIFR